MDETESIEKLQKIKDRADLLNKDRADLINTGETIGEVTQPEAL